MSWQTSLSSFSFSLSRLGADTGATDRNHSWVLAVLTLLLQLPVVTSWSGHRSNGPEPLLGPGSPHSPLSASRCHVLERTQEQRTGTTPGSWQSSLSSFSFSLSRFGADTGATDRNHSWVLAILTLLRQLPVVTSSVLTVHSLQQHVQHLGLSSCRAVAEDGKDVMRPESTVLEVLT